MREGARCGECQEQHGVDDEIVPNRKNLRQPTRERNDDNLSNEIRSRNPAAIISSCSDRTLDVCERGVDNLDVEHGHECAKNRAEHGNPCPDAGWGRSSRSRCAWPHDRFSFVSMTGTTDMPALSNPLDSARGSRMIFTGTRW